MSWQLLALLLCCVVLLAAAVRTTEINEHYAVQSLDPIAFECPSFCQECCDASTSGPEIIGGGAKFKCLLKVGISHCKKTEKAQKKMVMDQVEEAGYTCISGSLSRRHSSTNQWKIDCRYKRTLADETEQPFNKADSQCSKDTNCCCNVEADYVKAECIDPEKDDDGKDRVWYKFPRNFQPVDTPKNQVTFADAEKVLHNKRSPGDVFTQLADGQFYCGSKLRNEECAADSKKVYVERVRSPRGMCFGDESTFESITHTYGALLSQPGVFARDTPDEEALRVAIDDAHSKVKEVTVKNHRGKDVVQQECPSGWTSDLPTMRAGVLAKHHCRCDEACGSASESARIAEGQC